MTAKHKKILVETIEMAENAKPTTETQIKDNYKTPKDGMNSSIFDK